ncbi:hypothetical protein GCM10022217_27280 [Chryseobacterium ginsenosidimutans]
MVADSLYEVSETPLLQIKSLMLSATLYDQSGEFEKSLDFALQSQSIIENTDNAIWKAKIYGFLATHYRYLKLFDKSKNYIELGIKTTKDINDPNVSNNIMALLMQELAYYQIEQKNYKKSIAQIKTAKIYLAKVPSNNSFPLINNEQLLGYNYYNLGNLDKAFEHYENALQLSENLPENYLLGLIHNGIALIYLKKNKLQKAKEHLDIAMRIADGSKYLSLKNEIYETSEKYYALTKNIDDLVKTKEKRETIKNTLQNNGQNFINTSYTKIDAENIEIKKTNSIIIIVTLLLMIVAAIFFISYRIIQKREIKKFQQLLNDLDNKENLLLENENRYSIVLNSSDEKDINIVSEKFTVSLGTVEKILLKLKEFEDSNAYKNSNISLPYLAAYCKTNIKYLSFVLQIHKRKDFSTYINDLRVHYIVSKLRKDPKFRNYKISLLAEEAGFSSSSKFSPVFKKIIGMTPSAFIIHLKESYTTDT